MRTRDQEEHEWKKEGRGFSDGQKNTPAHSVSYALARERSEGDGGEEGEAKVVFTRESEEDSVRDSDHLLRRMSHRSSAPASSAHGVMYTSLGKLPITNGEYVLLCWSLVYLLKL